MVERVARAICAEGVSCTVGSFSPDSRETLTGEPLWRSYVSSARAALAALREPTEAMSKAGDRAALAEGAHDCEVRMSAVWRAMIATALGESGDGA